jgi:hypothetical protein
MMWCPECERELKSDHAKCPFCDSILTTIPQARKLSDQDFDHDEMNYTDFDSGLQTKSIEPHLLMESADQVSIDLVCNMLTENSIPFYVIDKGARGINKITIGGSVFAAEVYVDKTDFEKAKELAEIVVSPDEEKRDIVPLKESDNKSFHWRIVLFRVMVALFIIVYLVSYALSVMSRF